MRVDGVHVGLHPAAGPLIGIDRFGKTCPRFSSIVSIQVYSGLLSARPSFGGHDDYAVSRSRSVNGSRSIFQYGDAFYILRRDIVELSLILLDPVNYKQGVAHVSDVDHRTGTGTSLSLPESHTGQFTRKGGTDRRRGHFGNVLTLHGGYGTGNRLFFLFAIAHYDHFFQIAQFTFQRNVERVGITHGNFLGRIAYKSDDQHGIFRSQLKGKLPIQTGYGPVGRSFLTDTGSGYGFIRGSLYDVTCHCPAILRCGESHIATEQE